MDNKRLNNRKLGIGLLSGALLILVFIFSIKSNNGEAQETPKNIIAIHDSSSRQYNKKCYDCHSDILTEKSLNPSIPNAHLAMLPYTPGNRERQCIWCHRTVNLVQGTQPDKNSKLNLRKGVNVTLCTLCHSPSGPGTRFYQTDLLPTPPDGPLLYDLACAACHRDLLTSQMKGKSATEIQNAINKNKGGMGPLAVLSWEEIQAIANALAQ